MLVSVIRMQIVGETFEKYVFDVGIWDYTLSEDEFSKVFTDGITNREGKFTTTNIPKNIIVLIVVMIILFSI